MTEKISILHVEDDLPIAALVSHVLERSEEINSVLQVTSATDAVAALSAGKTDVVLLDLGLPDSQGFDTILRLRTSFPNIPIVVLTASTDEEIGLKAVECGAQDFISKDLIAGKLLVRAIQYAFARNNQIKRYKTLARTDPLTGLHNRQSFDTKIDQQIANWQKSDQLFTLMLLDVDYFKKVNDTHGHRAGDYALARLAEVIAGSCRDCDFIARFGGEEFAVVLPDAHLNSASEAAESIRSDVRSSPFLFESLAFQLTVSIGLAEFRPNDTAASLLERADRALYAAKEAGRDRCCQLERPLDPAVPQRV